MSELTFVFGPNNSFFFDSPKAWKFHNLPHTLRQLFQSYMQPEWHIAQPFCLALGPQHNSPEPIWYLGAKVVSGEEKILFSQQFFDINYPELSRWSKSIPNGSRFCRVTFGAAPFSFFACAPGHGSVWAAVPSELTDKVQKAFETPSCVALGYGDSWFVSWPHGSSAWNFRGAYIELEQILSDAAPRLVTHLALSPYNPQHYFVVFNDNTVRYNFAGVPEWQGPVNDVMRMWHEDLMQRPTYQQPYPVMNAPPPQQWNSYNPHVPPPVAAPVYIAAHYANAHSPPPGMAPYNNPVEIASSSAPAAFVAELPAEIPTNMTTATSPRPSVASPMSSPSPMSPMSPMAPLSPVPPPISASTLAPPPVSTAPSVKKKRGFFSRFKH